MEFKINKYIRPSAISPTGVDNIHNNFNNEKKILSMEDDANELIEKIEKIMKENKNNDDELLINEYYKYLIILINVNKNICSAKKVRVSGLNNQLITEETIKGDCEDFVKMMSDLNKIILIKDNKIIIKELKEMVTRYKYNFFFEKKNIDIDIGSKVKVKKHRDNNEGTIIGKKYLYDIKYDNGNTLETNKSLIKPNYEIKFYKGGKNKNKTKKKSKKKSKKKQTKNKNKNKNKTKKVKKVKKG